MDTPPYAVKVSLLAHANQWRRAFWAVLTAAHCTLLPFTGIKDNRSGVPCQAGRFRRDWPKKEPGSAAGPL